YFGDDIAALAQRLTVAIDPLHGPAHLRDQWHGVQLARRYVIGIGGIGISNSGVDRNLAQVKTAIIIQIAGGNPAIEYNRAVVCGARYTHPVAHTVTLDDMDRHAGIQAGNVVKSVPRSPVDKHLLIGRSLWRFNPESGGQQQGQKDTNRHSSGSTPDKRS